MVVAVRVRLPPCALLALTAEMLNSSPSGSLSSANSFSISTAREWFSNAPMLLSTTTGGLLATTVTVNVQLLVLSSALLAIPSVPRSRAVQVTVVVPGAKVLPEAGEQTTLGFGSQLSVAVGVV